MTVKENLEKLKSETKTASVKIIAVTKFATNDQIIEAFEAGARDFGENKLQIVEKKFAELPENIVKEAHWHWIGHLQTRKVKNVVGTFDLIHSVDSDKLAKKISEEAKNKNIVQDILAQINVAQEETKYGLSTEEVEETLINILNLENLNLIGLMTMAPLTQDEDIIRKTFRGLRQMRDSLQKKLQIKLTELSMGMSNDYKIAIQEGSTIIRVGQKLFA